MKTLVYRLSLLALWIEAGLSAFAHPVAQGALDIHISAGVIHISARVSAEQVMVADTFANHEKSEAATLEEVWARHGQYLLQHLKVFADGRRLTGRASCVGPVQNNFIGYQLDFPTDSQPAQVRLEEDVLNEIEYVPGNPWEAAYLVQIHQPGQPAETGILLSRQQPLVFSCSAQSTTATAATTTHWSRMLRQFVWHGIAHILGGYDHLLFVGALVLATATLWDLVGVITAFTLAHTTTLALSVLNIVRLPSNVVEPMIAGSIVFVAATNLLSKKGSRGRARLLTAFFFGLFHGLGFAGGLLDAMSDISGITLVLAIAAFSLGVEIGHQMVVLPVFFGMKFVRATRSDDVGREAISQVFVRGGSFVICMAGAFYLIAAFR